MTIWNSRTFTAFGMVCMLGACEDFDTGELLANLAPPSDAALPAVPLTQAMMMRGAVTLVPPSGYCIDPDSLTQSFALMARCDTLGAATGGVGAPAGLLTVSFARAPKTTPLPTAQEIATASDVGMPKDVRQSENHVVFRTQGKAPSSDLSPTHWRAAAQMNQFAMGATLFGPEGRRAVSGEGASVLEQLITRTTDKTNAS